MDEQSDSSQLVGVDVGGTFTDLVLLDQSSQQVRLAKVPSTLDNQAYGVLNALKEGDADLSAIDLFIHGTTTTTNAVLERKLAKTGMITTAGFRDILELGRRTRPEPYGMKGQFFPLIPRDLRLEVPERMDSRGEVVTALDAAAVADAAQSLLTAGCEAVVVHFLHSYANPEHEIQAAGLIQSIWPNSFITMGHALLSESREFERGVTAAVNASVQPLLERYLARLRRELDRQGYTGDVLVMNGNGGMVPADTVSQEAAKTVMSGPASGVNAAAYIGRQCNERQLITYDMGGTSTDVALIKNAEPAVSSEIELEYGLPIHVPMVDVRSVGAGGGSIAKVNAAGLLEVGPESAGATPGPICYGRGGSEPTLSDANFLLGRLNAKNLPSVDAEERRAEVSKIFRDQIAEPLDLTTEQAAAAVVQVGNTRMAGAIRMVSISLGEDPRDFALFAFGGAGPLHATELARELGIPRVLIPARPGITNAIGCLVSDLRYDYVNTVNRPLASVDMSDIQAIFSAQLQAGNSALEAGSITLAETAAVHSVDMQYVGQSHILNVPVPQATISAADLLAAFEKVYYDRFQIRLDAIPANLVNVNSSVIGRRHPLDLATLIDPAGRTQSLDQALLEHREVWFGDGYRSTPVYWRDRLPLDVEIAGPAIIEQLDTTVVIGPNDLARGDAQGNILIAIGEDGG